MTQPTAKPAGASRIRRAVDPAQAKPSAMRRWLGALPALVSFAGVAAFFVVVLTQNTERTDAWYRTQLNSAIQLHDYKTARLCTSRLLAVNPTDPALLLGLAQSLAGLNQTLQARQILNRLAPADHAGYAPAHLFIAEQLLELKHTPDVMALAQAHLRHVLESDPGNADALALLGAILGRR